MPSILADTTYQQFVVPIYSLDGMTLLIGAFFFYCLARPQRVQNRTQFWATFACLVLITLCYALRLMLYNSTSAQVFLGVCVGVLQASGLVLTVMYVGGLTAAEISDQWRDAAADFRNGGTAAKPTIVPLSGERPVVNEPPATTPAVPPRVVIDLPKRPPEERIPVE